MYISRVAVKNWKNFKEVETALGMRVFVIGPNAAGKSNFLDVFRFLRELANDGLRKAVDDARGGVSAIRALTARRTSDIEIEVTLANQSRDQWVYRLTFNQDHQKRPIVRQEVVLHNGVILLARPDLNDEKDPLLLTQTALEQILANQTFRPIADFFKSITYQHLLPQILRDPRGFSPLPIQDDPYGRDFLLRLWRTAPKIRDARLRKISAALQIAIPQLTELRAEIDETGVPHLIGRYEHWQPRTAKQTESQFSDGTLRLIGILWATFEGNGPLLLEEPEISLHTDVVQRLPAVFYRINRTRHELRQLIISTHSAALLADPGIDASEVLRLKPSSDGTLLEQAAEGEIEAMKAGLTAADVMMPKTAPTNIDQLVFEF